VIRINLLPHREEKRKSRRQQFFALAGLLIVLGGLVDVAIHGVIGGYISRQESKNDFLKKEIAILDKEIDEIKRLKDETEALLSRKQVIETLQANRAETVHLFNDLAKQTPDGVYLRSLKQTGLKIAIAGYAQSNARVSTLMRNLEASPVLDQPSLVEIKSGTAGNRRVSDFNMNVVITRGQAVPDAPKPVQKVAGGQVTPVQGGGARK
jgi:type IV pilus assembly protein PilN